MKIIKIFFCFFISTFFLHCKHPTHKTERKYNLKGVFHSLSIDGKLNANINDSNEIIIITINFQKKGREQKMVKTFVANRNAYYEQKLIGNLDNQIVDTVLVLAFIQKDTSTKYIYDYDKHPPEIPEGLDNWSYTITRENEAEYKLKKNHLRDSTFVEEYIYDKSYRIKKINLFYGSDTLQFN